MYFNLYGDLISRFKSQSGCKSYMNVPRIQKVCVNVGLSDAKSDSQLLEISINDISSIAGQKAVPTFAHKSIASFKIRQGFSIGCKVTLRKQLAFYFLQKLIYVALPNDREFKGFDSKSFDGNGNFSFGISDHSIFPEVDYSKIYKPIGMNVVIVTSTSSDSDAKRLLSILGFPFYD